MKFSSNATTPIIQIRHTNYSLFAPKTGLPPFPFFACNDTVAAPQITVTDLCKNGDKDAIIGTTIIMIAQVHQSSETKQQKRNTKTICITL
jgi:hypothetical protein